MIAINSRGQVCHGTGGGWASVDNVPFHRGGVAGWIDDDTVLFANGDDPFGSDWPASSYHVPTKTTTRLLGETGMNHGYASNAGHWAIWWGTPLTTGGIGRGGLWASTGLHLPAAGLMGMGPDGSMAYKPDYQSGGPTQVREVNRTEWTLTPNHAYSLQLLGQKRAVFVDTGTGLTFLNLPTPLTLMPGGASGFKAAYVNGQWWIAYYSERRAQVILHPFNELVGYAISRPGDAWFNLRVLTGGLIYVPWSSKEGEQPGEMTLDDSVMFDVTADPRMPLFVPDSAPPHTDAPHTDVAPPPIIVKPKVTVLKWDALMKAGVHWHAKFQVNVPSTIDVSKNVKDQLVIAAWDEHDTDTTAPRQLTVEGPEETTEPPDPPNPEPPPMSILPRFLYSPSIGSRDVAEVFNNMNNLQGVEAYAMPVQHILTDEPTDQIGPNTYPHLVALGFFQKLKDAGIHLIVEKGSIKPYDCQAKNGIADLQKSYQRVRDAGGIVFAYAMDEPLTANQWPVEQGGCHQTLDMCADAVANYIHAIHDIDPEILVGWWEAWPEVSFDDQRRFLQLLLDRNALPDYSIPDVFWDHTTDAKAKAFFDAWQHECDKFGLALCCSVNSTKDPIDPDQAHYNNLITLAKRIYALKPDVAHVITAAWASRQQDDPTHKTQNVPNCLGPAGMIQTHHDVTAIFGDVSPEPPPTGEDMKSTTILDLPPLAVKEVRPGDSGVFSLILADDPSDKNQPPGATYSMQPGGKDGFRPNDGSPVEDYQPGQYEKCTVDGNLATFCPAGEYFSRWFVRVGGL